VEGVGYDVVTLRLHLRLILKVMGGLNCAVNDGPNNATRNKEQPMATNKTGGRLTHGIAALKRLRSDTQIDLEAARKDARQRWQDLERRFHQVERGVSKVTREVVGDLADRYRELRKTVRASTLARGQNRKPARHEARP
jgi:hypothetical protein